MAALLTPETLLDPAVVAAARKGRADYLIESTYRDRDQPGTKWYADLRMLVPVSKGLLIGKGPGVCAFSPDKLLRFSAALAHKFGRAAIDDVLVIELPKAINDHVMSSGPSQPGFVGTEEVRLQIFPGRPLARDGVGVLIIVEPEALDDARKVWPGWRARPGAG